MFLIHLLYQKIMVRHHLRGGAKVGCGPQMPFTINGQTLKRPPAFYDQHCTIESVFIVYYPRHGLVRFTGKCAGCSVAA